jgi:hypothetical protein
MTSKNDILTYFLMYFCQKSGRGTTLLTPPFPLGVTAITDHLRARTVPPGCGPQSSTVPVRTKSVSGPRPCRVLNYARSLAFSSSQLAQHRSGWAPETGRLYNAEAKNMVGKCNNGPWMIMWFALWHDCVHLAKVEACSISSSILRVGYVHICKLHLNMGLIWTDIPLWADIPVPGEDNWCCWCHLCKHCNLICGVGVKGWED